MKFKIDINYLVFFFFFSYFIIGLFITVDYPVTPDEPLHRINGFISLKFISDLFLLNIDLKKEFLNLPSLNDDWRKTYGVVFDLPLAFVEYFFKIGDIKNVFLLRHFLTFILFFIGNIYFFFLIKNNTKKIIYPIIGTIILITTPRIFSHSFYNSRDILFLSFMVIAVFYSLNLLKTFNLKNLFLSCLFCALATNIRVIAIYLPFLTFFFYFFRRNQKSKITTFKFCVLFFLLYFSFIYLMWPYLWLDPFNNFIFALKESTNYPAFWNFEVLYLGRYINPENLPWHYFFIWFLSTTPFIFLLTIIFGIYYFIKKYLIFFLKINFNKNFFLWKNTIQMTQLYTFLVFFIPIFFVICLNSTMYSGWRHLFFVYPPLIFLSMQVLSYLETKHNLHFFKYFFVFIFIQLVSNIFFIYKSHPVQNIYFNFFSTKLVSGKLPLDYWGIGNKATINYLLSKNSIIKISTGSYTPLNNVYYSINKENSYTDKLKIYGTSIQSKIRSDYIFTNYYYNKNPKFLKKYIIPDDFKSYYKLIINGNVVNEVFKRVKK